MTSTRSIPKLKMCIWLELEKKIYFVEIGQQLLKLKPEASSGVELSRIKYVARTLEFSECIQSTPPEPEYQNLWKPIKKITVFLKHICECT